MKQETDKLRDEDLYKFLAEIKRPSSAPKKLKCIPGTLKIEVSPCPDEIKNGLTPELAKLHPYGGEIRFTFGKHMKLDKNLAS